MSDAELMQKWRDEFARTNGHAAPEISQVHASDEPATEAAE